MSREKDFEDSLKVFRREINKYEVFNETEQKELLKKYHETGDKELLDLLLKHNLRLAVMVARKHIYNRKSMELIDLIQECSISLILAIENYDENKGASFFSYATQVMENNIKTEIFKKDRVIKIPVYLQILSLKKNKYVINFYAENNRYPTDEEIKQKLQITDESLEYLKTISNYDIKSLNEINLLDEDKDELQEFIPIIDENLKEVENGIDDLIIMKAAKEILTEEEYYIIYHRKISENNLTLKELGNILDVEGESVRIKEKRALEKLKRCIKRKKHQVLEKYRIIDLEREGLKPLELDKKCLFLYLKENLSSEEYYYIYTQQVLNYRVEDYLIKNNSISSREVEEQINAFNDIYESIATKEFIENNFKDYMEKYGSNKIFKMSIDPSTNIEQNKRIKQQKRKGRRKDK